MSLHWRCLLFFFTDPATAVLYTLSLHDALPISLSLVASGSAGNSRETAPEIGEEGGDDVKSSWPLCPGLHTCYNGRHKGLRWCEPELIPKNRPQYGLQSATRLHEAGIASNPRSARWGEYVPGPCTHRPSHHESQLYRKPARQPSGGSRPWYAWRLG